MLLPETFEKLCEEMLLYVFLNKNTGHEEHNTIKMLMGDPRFLHISSTEFWNVMHYLNSEQLVETQRRYDNGFADKYRQNFLVVTSLGKQKLLPHLKSFYVEAKASQA